MAGEKSSLVVSVQVRFVDVPDGERPQATAYAFSADGQLLTQAPISEKGEAKLELPAERTARLRVLVGPAAEKGEVTFAELLRRGAEEQQLRIDPGTLRYELPFVIYPDIWRCWLKSLCFVRGTLYKRVLIGGEYENFPVCNATVEVYEVDPLWLILPRLPEIDIDRLRDIVLERIPLPIPEPIPGPDPAPFARAAMAQVVRAQAPAGDPILSRALRLMPESASLRQAAQLGSRLQFQDSLLKHPEILRPLLCWFYPRFVTMQKVATATTDDCGHFRTLFFKGCHNPDQPDLYFKARQKLFGWLDVYIYAPTPIACHTHWNYSCGTEVTLYTKSPWAHTCAPCPPVIGPPGENRWVAFMAIGARGLNNIYGTATDLQSEVDDNNRGLLKDETTNPPAERPWGGLLLPRLEFSPDLEAAGVRYYQMGWRRGSGGDFLPLTGEIHHYYRHDVAAPTGNMPVWSPEKLGPVEVDDGAGHKVPHLFRIPYASVAPSGVWDVPPDINEIREHLASARFPTREIAPGMTYDAAGGLHGVDTSGKYQLELRLFDSQGKPVDIAALGIVFAVPMDPNTSGDILTVDAASLGLVSGNRLIVTLHVDNNPCYAEIAAPAIGAATADPCCGVLQYQPGDSVSMAFTAAHPHGFASYSFRVVRGSNEVFKDAKPVTASSSPIVKTVQFLMKENLSDDCKTKLPGGCTVAGFGEYLYVDSLATDGWTTELGYDRDDLEAFVLTAG
jgi:hypothetical protein